MYKCNNSWKNNADSECTLEIDEPDGKAKRMVKPREKNTLDPYGCDYYNGNENNNRQCSDKIECVKCKNHCEENGI